METSAIYSNLVSIFIAPFLTRKGFSKEKKDWFLHWEGENLWRIATTFRRVRNRDEGWLGVTVCVGFRPIAVFLKSYSDEMIDDANKPCAMATDIGHLKPPFNHFEYRILPDVNRDLLGQEIVNDIDKYVLPYFVKYGDLEHVIAAWEKNITYNLGATADFYIASAYWLRGEKERAIEIIKSKIAHYDSIYREKSRRSDELARIEREDFLKFLFAKKDQ